MKGVSKTDGQIKSILAQPKNLKVNKKLSAKQQRKMERKKMNKVLKQKRFE